MNGHKKNVKPKYPFQRVEKKHIESMNADRRSMNERAQMERQSAQISIGTFTIFKPKPDALISDFTLALPVAVPKTLLYPALKAAFNSHWEGEPTKSVFIKLSQPIPLADLRALLKQHLDELLQ